jgi:hypothetical protein
MKNHSVVIRMGAAHWDVTLVSTGTRFNLRTMSRDQRGKFHGAFMSSIRKDFRNKKAS